ncbi:MAG: hypothetical protein Q9161_007806 [Pseudevernia consocians]
MASTTALLAATFTLFSSALAFSPDQCNLTSYGAPTKAACNTLLTNIAKLGTGNTSYLFIPSEFPTPEGLPNNTRKNFPQSWSTTGCKAALVPIQVSSSSVTYDTSSYQDLASAGQIVVQECISNSTSSGGWELAGDDQELVLHIYAAGSEIDATITKQSGNEIAATSEDQIDDAELDDPDYNGSDGDDGDDSGDDSDDDSGFAVGGLGTGTASAPGFSTKTSAPATMSHVATPASSSAPAASPTAVMTSGTFNYLGCELDSSTSRTLSSLSWAGTGLTVERCASYCATYQYMGVEFGSEYVL